MNELYNDDAEFLKHNKIIRYEGTLTTGRRIKSREAKWKETFAPFLLQGSEVLLEDRADLAQQLHQRMAQEAGIGWLGVKGVGGRSGTHITNIIIIHVVIMAFL